MAAAGLLVCWLGNRGSEDIVGISSSLVLVTYLVGAATGCRLLEGRSRVYSAIGLALTAVVIPFATAYLMVPVIVAALAAAYRWLSARRS
ncbi:hypothetical protein [Streptomyces antioxidans]|uniref:hypothetical protein n=1 Tax=Streptomyces antioxidans TaxID=1507734 RepID=UPI00117FC215|nr:hypothetical protein [Streptomyces antioxidans]